VYEKIILLCELNYKNIHELVYILIIHNILCISALNILTYKYKYLLIYITTFTIYVCCLLTISNPLISVSPDLVFTYMKSPIY